MKPVLTAFLSVLLVLSEAAGVDAQDAKQDLFMVMYGASQEQRRAVVLHYGVNGIDVVRDLIEQYERTKDPKVDGACNLLAEQFRLFPQPAIQRGILEFLGECINSPWEEMRIAAIRALGNIGGQESIKALERRMDDEVPAVRHYATGAMARVGDGDALVRMQDRIKKLRANKDKLSGIQSGDLMVLERNAEKLQARLEGRDDVDATPQPKTSDQSMPQHPDVKPTEVPPTPNAVSADERNVGISIFFIIAIGVLILVGVLRACLRKRVRRGN